jgi:DNA-binding NarL/FixJ family response regulator
MKEHDIRVLIVEDIKEERETFSLLLNHCPGYICVESLENADHIVDRIKETLPDVILMDISLGAKRDEGIEAVRTIKRHYKKIPIIMRTVFDDEERIFKSLRAGARGYLLKDTPIARVLDALKEAKNFGVGPISPSIITKVMDFFEQQSNELSILTSTENKVLEQKMKGFTHAAIAEKLYVSKNTVDFHMKNIYEKLEVHSTNELREKFPNSF